MTAISSDIIITCWTIFVTFWWVSAARTKPIAEKQSLQSALAHRIPVGLASWLLAVPKFPPPLNHVVLPRNVFSQIIGVVICVGGLSVTLWARRILAGNWSSDVTFKHGHELVRTGPYRFVRHPIYTGLLLMFLGTAIYIGELRGFLSIPLVTIGFWIKLRQEERLLRQHFPETYPIYQQEVKALVPFVI
jgi:protein-S-isoprenylcysteine O-methyltransferase Ste14